jgi:hypothetical protein
MARLQAEELVLPELVLLPPEPGADPDQEPDQPETRTGQDELPVVVDRSHPLWEQVNAEQEALATGS